MAYGARLESVLGASPRGFESPILRRHAGPVTAYAGRALRRPRAGVRPSPAVRRVRPAAVGWTLVATFSSVTQQHILQAIAEYDARGGEQFLAVYGFEAQPAYVVLHEGAEYDARAVLGVAHRFATGRMATSDDFHGMDAAVALLRRRGFEVTDPYASAAPVAPARPTRTTTPKAPRAPRATTPRAPSTRAAAREERPLAICPTCFQALPATGVCDNCS